MLIPSPTGNAPDHAQGTAAVLAADDPKLPGLLPEAEVVGYRLGDGIVMTKKRRYYGVATESRDDYDALLMNNSWGETECSKIGDYNKRAKWRDQAVVDSGILIVTAAGNNRGKNAPDQYYADCDFPEFFSLSNPVAKNDILVGNWCFEQGDFRYCPNANMINATSGAGPAADFRLKPDLVAPR